MRTSAAPLVMSAFLALLLSGCAGSARPTSTQFTPAPGRTNGPTGPNAATPTTGASATGPVAASVDSCTILSDGEIAAATSENVTERSASTLTKVFPSVCDVELDGGGSLTVSILPTGGRALYEASFEPYIGQESSLLDAVVMGLGDKAASSGHGELMVLQGDVLYDIMYVHFGRNDTMTVVRYLAEIILAKLPCLAAGCPGFTPPPPPSAAAAVDACALLTADEIKTGTGLQTLDTEPQSLPGQDPQCTWTLDTQPFPGTDYIELTLMATGGRAQFDFWAGAYDPPLEHVSGIGDDAIRTATIPGGSIYAIVGDELLTMQFSLPLSIDDPYALVVPLVAKAVPRL